MLTSAQQVTLKAFILADPVFSLKPATAQGAYEIAAGLESLAENPAWTVWRNNVTSDEIGNAWNGSDIDGLSGLNMQRLQLMLQSSPQGTFDMGRTDRRAGFENPFGANANGASRVAMRAVWKRSANRLEKLFSVGTGTDTTPAMLIVVGSIGYNEVGQAMGWSF